MIDVGYFKVYRSFGDQLTNKVKHFMENKNIKYHCDVLVGMQVACSLYKHAHVVKYLHCSKL
jgi:hypothetical protein